MTSDKATTKNAKALLIGIDYEDTPRARLRGCQNDAIRMRDYLVTHRGYAKENVRVAVDRDGAGRDATSRSGITEAVLRLASASYRDALDEVFIHYSGHGTQRPDADGGEVDGMDEAIIPSDFHRAGVIGDDKLNDLLQEFRPDTSVVCVFDCCHSGTVLDLPWRYRRGGSCSSPSMSEERVKTGNPTPCPVVCISGCRDDQVSMDAYDVLGRNKHGGAMTGCLLHVLRDTGPRPRLRELFCALHEELQTRGFAQRPVLTSSVQLEPVDDDDDGDGERKTSSRRF